MVSCKDCKRKISKYMIDMYTCKCKLIFCSQHLHDHNCTFNHLNYNQNILKNKMPVVKPMKGRLTLI